MKPLGVNACLIKAKLINDKECTWNGCLFEHDNKACVITTAVSIAMLLPCKHLKLIVSKRFKNLSSYVLDVQIGIKPEARSEKLVLFNAIIMAAWKSYKFARTLRQVKFSSEFIAGQNQSQFSDSSFCCYLHQDDDLLSWFVMLDVENFKISFPWLSVNAETTLHQGMEVCSFSYPFGDDYHPSFHNCISKGIISNQINDNFLLIDACCLPGSHGAVVVTSENEMVGFVICPLELKNGQLTGMTIVCSWKEVYGSYLEQHCFEKLAGNSVLSVNKLGDNHSKGVEVVCLQHGRGWGSGVAVGINKDLHRSSLFVATCCHVVAPAANRRLQATLFCGTKNQVILEAKVIYSTVKDSWLDFALLEIPCKASIASKLIGQMQDCLVEKGTLSYLRYPSKYTAGTALFAKGHCLFENSCMLPTITNGVLSQALYAERYADVLNHSPVLLHTNCIVLDGASGGGVFSGDQQCFYGLIVNNVKQLFDDQKHVLYPKINFVLPSGVFMPFVVSFLLKNSSFAVLDDLALDKQLKQHWLLQCSKTIGIFFRSKL